MKDHFKDLQQFNQWANEVVAEAIENNNVPPKAVELMSHIVNANILWLDRLEGRISETEVWRVYEKVKLKDVLAKSDLALMNFILDADESKFSETIDYTNSKGEVFSSVVGEILTHICVHSAYHRGQIISIIKDTVSPIPYTDYIHYARKIKQP